MVWVTGRVVFTGCGMGIDVTLDKFIDPVRKEWLLNLVTLCWQIWKARNEVVFESICSPPHWIGSVSIRRP